MWGLETSLERTCYELFGNLEKANQLEDSLSREFKRRFHHYSSIIPAFDDHLQWFSLMRHYGAPTRLMDWTYSRYIAAYFALEYAKRKKGSCSIWAINTAWATEMSCEILEKNGISSAFLRENVDDQVEQHFRNVFFPERGKRKPFRVIIPINPFQINERLTIQKGLFFCPGDISKSFQENLRRLPGYDNNQNVMKLNISMSERVTALMELHEMNISRATLFPGLEGFAESLNVYHPSMGHDELVPPSPVARH